jgi:hypothetical protein
MDSAWLILLLIKIKRCYFPPAIDDLIPEDYIYFLVEALVDA